jgi:hypothetical protein
MPALGSLTCEVVLAHETRPLHEYSTTYYNSGVEVYIAIPSTRSQFYISVKADAYIAYGLAAFVFIDSKYQANRNHRGFTPQGRALFDVFFKGGEISGGGDEIVVTDWWFDNVNFGELPFLSSEGGIADELNSCTE